MKMNHDNFIIDLKYIIYTSHIRFYSYFKTNLDNINCNEYESFKSINLDNIFKYKFSGDLFYLIDKQIKKINDNNLYLSFNSLNEIDLYFKLLYKKESQIEESINYILKYNSIANNNCKNVFYKKFSFSKFESIKTNFHKNLNKLNLITFSGIEILHLLYNLLIKI